jgi:tetratricopeptide (TPR) repeat protein
MFKKIHRFKIWFILGIMGVMGVVFLGALFRFAGFGAKKEIKGSLFEMAKQHYMDGAYKKAASLYEKLLVLEPKNGNAMLDLAIIYDDYLNNDERSIELYKKYLEIFPDVKKKKLIEEWMKDSAQDSLGVKGASEEEKIKQLEKEIDDLNKDRGLLKQQVEDLSGKLYTIQSAFQKEKKELQAESERLASEVTSARVRIGKLAKELSIAENNKKELMEKLESVEKKQKVTKADLKKQIKQKKESAD